MVLSILGASDKVGDVSSQMNDAVSRCLADADGAAPSARSPEESPAPNVRCAADSFGNYSCSDGSRVIRDSFGNVTAIPGRK